MRIPLTHVIGCVSGGGSFSALRLGPISSTPVGIDGRLVSSGRLRVPRTIGTVAVELRLSPYSSTASFVELVLVGRGRYPRRYWTFGHDALSAFKHAAGAHLPPELNARSRSPGYASGPSTSVWSTISYA